MILEDCRPLIISGAPRSGTSLIYNLFDGHPDINWLVDEGYLFEYLDDLGQGAARILLDAVPSDIEAVICGIRDKQVMPPIHLPYKQVKNWGSVSEVEIDAPWDEAAFRAALADTRPADIAGLWRWLVNACLAGMGEPPKRYACMKSPDYGKSVVSALKNIPEARAIVILRDPIYAIDSLKRSRELRGEKLLTWPLVAHSIRCFQELGVRVRTADATRLRVVRYEGLVADPRSIMSDLVVWLGIPFDPCLLRPTMRGQHWPGISSFNETRGIDTSPTERPILALTEDEQALIRKHLAPFRAVLGYA